MMKIASKMMNFAIEMMKFAFQMINFALGLGPRLPDLRRTSAHSHGHGLDYREVSALV